MRDKVVIITGGTRGIGLAMAHEFAKHKAKLILSYHSDEERAEQAKREILLHANEQEVDIVRSDVSDSKSRIVLIERAIHLFGSVDILINNAGITSRVPFLETMEKDFDRIIETNLKAPIFLAKIFAKQLIQQQQGGAIINIASSAAHRVFPNLLHYSVAKSALVNATKHMAKELAPYAIRVNCISPGYIKTDINRDKWEGNPKQWQKETSIIPMQRAGGADEIAATALYLASEQASYITGVNIDVDGGLIL